MEALQTSELPEIELFPDDTQPDVGRPPVMPTVTEYRRAFRAIKWYRAISDTASMDEERVLEQIEREKQNVRAFYEHKRKQAAQRIALWTGQLDVMMKLNGVEKRSTPYGTCFYAEAKKKTWNASDEDLLAFAKQAGEKDLVNTKEYPNKREIEGYINSTGKGAELLTVTTRQEVRVRITNEV